MDEEEPPRPKGIELQVKAPIIDTVDIHDNKFNLIEALKEYDGVLIDFFRGNW